MKRTAVAVLAVVLPGGASLIRGAELGPSRPPGVLRVLVAADEQPEFFSFGQAGPPGIEREMIETFARGRQLKVEIVPVRSFDQIIPSLLRGEGDVIVGIVNTEARRRELAFTTETYPVRHLAVTRQPQPPVHTLEELRALRVGILPGTSWAAAAMEAGVPAANRLPFTDTNDMLEGLRAGKIGAAVMSVFDFAMARRRDPNLEAGLFLGAPAEAAWAIRKEDAALAAALNQYLDNLRTSPARSALFVKYFDEQALSLVRRARSE